MFGLDYVHNGVKLGDVVINGRPLREYTAASFDAWLEVSNFEHAVYAVIPMGEKLSDIMGPVGDEIMERRSFLIKQEDFDYTKSVFTDYAKRLFERDDVEIVRIFEIAHMGWESDNDYAVVRVDGTLHIIGTDHGSPKIVERSHVEGAYEDAIAKAVELKEILNL